MGGRRTKRIWRQHWELFWRGIPSPSSPLDLFFPILLKKLLTHISFTTSLYLDSFVHLPRSFLPLLLDQTLREHQWFWKTAFSARFDSPRGRVKTAENQFKSQKCHFEEVEKLCLSTMNRYHQQATTWGLSTSVWADPLLVKCLSFWFIRQSVKWNEHWNPAMTSPDLITSLKCRSQVRHGSRSGI